MVLPHPGRGEVIAILGVMPAASTACVCKAHIATHSAAPGSITMNFEIASVMADSNAPPSTGCGHGFGSGRLIGRP